MGRFGGKRSTPSADTPRRRSSGQSDPSREAVSDIERGQYTFRRNRTLTGSSSPKIASSSELKAEMQSPRAHVHHLNATRRMLGLYLALVVVAIFSVYVLLSQLTASVLVQIPSVAVVPASDQLSYQKTYEAYYAGRPIERLRFLANIDELTGYIQATHPEVKSVRLEPGSKFGETTAVMNVRSPVARWAIGGQDSFVDDSGIVFVRNYKTDPAIEIVDNSGIKTSAGESVASDRFLGFVGRVIAGTKSQNLRVTTITIPALTTRQVLATVEGQKTAYRLSIDRAAGEQAEDMARVSRYLAANGLQPTYVDLRIKGKAYYR